ncbi:Peroxiredoxin [Aquiflexum balticum DSM 16537]|uniref:thioredoxin-dependent peroxiredoxin n=1 Tax=Aquiflexum balticum DSM 16537 TaxID=758820 RepID=A0A1W2H9M5_9BACT|nr:peroxiredoxin-like family protein [Aquiflexum balticum]SMD45398.1 Peroxiredoxin [Aquiflexum balticum DSM 16537]
MKFISMAIFSFFLMGNLWAQDKNTKSVKEAKGLEVGATVPSFEAIDQNGKTQKLDDLLKEGPVVLVFYRGQWCPICNRHLSALNDSLNAIYEKGAKVVAISPERPEYIRQTIEKTNAGFTLLYDEGYRISESFDVAFLPDFATRASYNTALKADLKDAHSDDSQRLPIPATFIINQDKKVVWRHFDPNYRNRASVNDILMVLSR